MDFFSLISLIGGLTFFLYGMSVMSSSLEKMSGGKLEEMLRQLTAKPLLSMVLGAVITIAVQSSSSTTVMLVGLVNSGIMQFSQTVNVIFGANIGTTFTAWLTSLSGIDSDAFFLQLLKPKNFSPILAFIGILMVMFSKRDKRKSVGTAFVGFAILMYGMELMAAAMSPLADMPELEGLLTSVTSSIIAVCTAFHSIQFAVVSAPHAYPTLPEELTLCMQLLLPCLEAALFLCRVRRDLFEKYTPLFNPMAGAASDRHD